MIEFTDQMNQTIRLDFPLTTGTSRIVSLVPSQTELLHHLGLEEEVVGITKFCIHPEVWFRSKQRVGGTKSVNLEKVKALKPDLIIGNKEENAREDIEALKEIAPVWMSDIYNLPDAMDMLHSLGDLLGKQQEVKTLQATIKAQFSLLREEVKSHPLKGKTVLYFIWNDPDFLAGKNTFIDKMLAECGLINAAEGDRYPEADLAVQPDYIFLSSEPFPFKEKHMASFQEKYPNATIVLVDGEMFSWYGSRLKDAPSYFLSLINGLVQKSKVDE